MSSRLATFILIPTHKGNREAVRPLPSNVKRPHASQNISPGTFPKTEISFREFRVFRGSKTGAPGCNPGRAPRAGGRNSDDQSGTSMRIPKVGEDPRVLPPVEFQFKSDVQRQQHQPAAGFKPGITPPDNPIEILPIGTRRERCIKHHRCPRSTTAISDRDPEIRRGGPMCPPAWQL